MMGGFGLAQDAIVRTRQNKSLRTSQKHNYYGGTQNSTSSQTRTHLKKNDISAEELEVLKDKIRKQARKEKIKMLVIASSVLGGVILGLAWFFF